MKGTSPTKAQKSYWGAVAQNGFDGDSGAGYQLLINPTHFQYLPQPPKDE